jgi:hypothetical protein
VKKLLITLLLAVLSTSAMAEWVPITDNDIATTYVDPTTIRKAGNKVKMWAMIDFKKKTEDFKGSLSQASQYEIDCQNETTTQLAWVWYSGNMRTGHVLHSDNKRGDASPNGPGTVGEFMWKIACGK